MPFYLFMDFAIDVSLPPVIASWLTANVLTSLWVSLSWNSNSPSSSTVHSNKLNYNIKTTRVCCLMRTCRVALVYKARIKHGLIVSDNVVTEWSSKQGYNFFISHSLTEQAVVGELKRFLQIPAETFILPNITENGLLPKTAVKMLNLWTRQFFNIITLHVKSYHFNNCGKKLCFMSFVMQ